MSVLENSQRSKPKRSSSILDFNLKSGKDNIETPRSRNRKSASGSLFSSIFEKKDEKGKDKRRSSSIVGGKFINIHKINF